MNSGPATIQNPYDPSIYDSQKNIIGTAPKAPGGFSANVMFNGILTSIGTVIHLTRQSAEDAVWAAYLKHNPSATRP